jgi:ribosomal protein S25
MPDLLDRIRNELNARIRELRPVVREFERLERAAEAMARSGARSVPGLRSRVAPAAPGRAEAKRGAGRAAQAAPRKTSPARKGAASRRQATPRGQTQAKVLAALQAAPGSGPAAVAKASGVATSVAAATLSRLAKQGRVRRVGRGRYTTLEEASVAGPAEETTAARAT